MFSTSRPRTFSHLDGLQAIDTLLAQELCELLGRQQDELLLHSIMAVSFALRDGHSCLHLERVAGETWWCNPEQGYSGYTFPGLQSWHDHLADMDCHPEQNQPIVFDRNRLYLRRYWQFEQEVGHRLGRMSQQLRDFDLNQGRMILEKLFADQPSSPTDWQMIAVANALGRDFTIIAGGPGTGKTFTVTKLLAALIELAETPLKIALVAPTGKAAQRLNESITKAKTALVKNIDPQILHQIPQSASTIHRLLGVIPGKIHFRQDQQNLLSLDLLVIDEVSMIDLPLMARLLRALPQEIVLIMLGDADQLPSVAAGSILADIAPRPHPGFSPNTLEQLKKLTGIDSLAEAPDTRFDHLTFLQYSHRFADDGGIGLVANQVLAGNAAESWKLLKKGSEQTCLIHDIPFSDWLKALVEQYFQPVIEAKSIEQAFACLAKFRFLTPTRIGHQGVVSLNQQIEDHLRQQSIIQQTGAIYHGKPIMITENHYGLHLYNGDIGLIWKNPEDQKLTAAFLQDDQSIRWITPRRLPGTEPVFAMTIHKTQGSEYHHVALVLPEVEPRVLSRELLYTGITRASKQLTVWSSKEIWQIGVKRKIERYSGLALCIQDSAQNDEKTQGLI